jgi:hypothetical protein
MYQDAVPVKVVVGITTHVGAAVNQQYGLL